MRERKKRFNQKQAFFDQLPQKSLETLICHDIGHKWEPATLEVEYGHFQLGLVCSRCQMERERGTDFRGERITRYWHPHPEEYYFQGAGRRTREQRADIAQTWQNEMLGRLPRPEKD